MTNHKGTWCDGVGRVLGQRTGLHFTDGNMNEQRYRGEILTLIVEPFVELHLLNFQQDDAHLHIASIFLGQEALPVLTGCHIHKSPIDQLWVVLVLPASKFQLLRITFNFKWLSL